MRSCPSCNSPPSNAKKFAEKNLDTKKMSSLSYASRKMPEFMCYELVECSYCDLVYSTENIDSRQLVHAYEESDFDSATEASDAALTYSEVLAPFIRNSTHIDAALEIGSGTGAFLSHLINLGIKKVIGIEPSSSAIESAHKDVKSHLIKGEFDKTKFNSEEFDLICCFMTLEHVYEPDKIISACKDLLATSGSIALVIHDRRSWINRILGLKSPIIDVEHMQLFSPTSIKFLLEKNSFTNIKIKHFKNTYSLGYWVKLLPLPFILKDRILHLLQALNLDKIKVKINVGNMFVFANK